MRKLSGLFFLVLGYSAWAFGQENCLSLEGLTRVECTLEPVTPLSVHYPAHAHRFRAEERQGKLFVQGLSGVFEETSGMTGPTGPIFATSDNWAGYVAAPNFLYPVGSVDEVAGSWHLPTLSATGTTGNCYSSTWVGLDGFLSETIEQIGTGSDWISGAQVNSAWYEIFPNPPYLFEGFPLNNNDVIAAAVQYTGLGCYQLTLVNQTQAVYTVVEHCSGPRFPAPLRNTAEWIVEAPTSLTGILPLANFQTTNFTDCFMTVGGITDKIDSSFWNYLGIEMEDLDDYVKALPSALGEDGQSFSVTWERSN